MVGMPFIIPTPNSCCAKRANSNLPMNTLIIIHGSRDTDSEIINAIKGEFYLHYKLTNTNFSQPLRIIVSFNFHMERISNEQLLQISQCIIVETVPNLTTYTTY